MDSLDDGELVSTLLRESNNTHSISRCIGSVRWLRNSGFVDAWIGGGLRSLVEDIGWVVADFQWVRSARGVSSYISKCVEYVSKSISGADDELRFKLALYQGGVLASITCRGLYGVFRGVRVTRLLASDESWSTILQPTRQSYKRLRS